jgi:VWFA-related protein
MSRRLEVTGWAIAVIAFGVSGLLVARLAAQARERVLYVSVYDSDSLQPVKDLKPDGIVVREDGVRREVLRVTPATTPMPIAVVIDNSAATTPNIADLRRGLTAFIKGVDGLGPVAIVTVASRPTIVRDYTTDQKELLDSVNRLFAEPGSGATLLDAIADVSKGLGRREAERAAIVIVTTENTDFSHLHYSEVLDAIKGSGAAVHAVVLVNPSGSLGTDEARNRATVLDRGPRESGGVRTDILTSLSFDSRLRDLAGILQSQYRVVYARPESLIPPEKIDVSSAAPRRDARATPARGQAVK